MIKYDQIDDTVILKIITLKSTTAINDIIKLFNKFAKENIKNIKIDFNNLHEQSYSPVHVSILGIIEFYRNNFSMNIVIEENSKQYIGKTFRSYYKGINQVFINNIFDKVLSFSSSEDVELISNQIMNQLKDTVNCEEGVLIGTSWCINEIMDNVLNHSEAKQGYIMVQVHKKRKHISISIFDTGIGLLNSFKKSIQYNPKNEIDAIELAIKKGVTSNTTLGQGNGLWGLMQIVSNNKGFMSIVSGHTEIKYDFSMQKKSTISNIPIISKENLTTRIDFTLNFKNLINVNKVLGDYVPYEKISRDIENNIDENGWIKFSVNLESKKIGKGTREAGKKLRTRIINIAKIDNSPILIDFINVDFITSSFADEFIGKLIFQVGYIEFNNHFRIINTNEFVSNLLNKAIIERQNLKKY